MTDHVALIAGSCVEKPLLWVFLAKYISSLARIRTGISDALISCGVLERLIDKLYSPSLPQTSDDAGDEIEMHMACAVAIGTLTYNKTAFRLLYNLVRRSPGTVSPDWRPCLIRWFQICTTKSLPPVNDRVCHETLSAFSRANEPTVCPWTGKPKRAIILLLSVQRSSLSVQLHVLDARPVSSSKCRFDADSTFYCLTRQVHRRSTAGSDRETPSRVRTARSRLESQAPSVVSHRPSTARMADRRRLTLSSKSTRT